MIEQSTIQRIFDTAEIRDVVSDFVTLKKRGVNYIGLCPFHNEKTPSFIVSPSKGIYKCFGCGKGGNAVNFVMEIEQLSYIEALKYLANKYSIPFEERELSPAQQKQRDNRESMLIVSAYARDHFVQNLQTQEGKAVGLSYLKERGFRDDIISKFQLGYCANEWDGFTKSALKEGYKQEYLVSTGLTIENEKGCFDRFKGRVIFPIHGLAGKVIAFGGRTLENNKKTAKYLNSPESEIYHKSRVLYGIYFAKRSIVQKDKCLLVEGYTDVLSFHQSGIENVVASSGTALTQEQIRLIKRFTNNITVIYDGDEAGIKASLRGIDLILEQGLNVKVLLLPDKEDPDSFAKSHSSSELISYIDANETDFIVFKTKLLLDDAKDDPIKRANLITDIVRSIAIIPASITRSVYVKECSNLLEVEEKVIYQEISKIKNSSRYSTNSEPKQEAQHTQVRCKKYRCDEEEKMLIRYLLIYGNKKLKFNKGDEEQDCEMTVGAFIVEQITTDNLESENPLYKEIFTEYKDNYCNEDFEPAKYFRDHADAEISTIAVDILSEPYELSKVWTMNESFIETEDDKLKELVPKIVNEYKEKKVELLLKKLTKEIKEAQDNEDIELLKTLLQKQMLFTRLRQHLLKELGNRIII